MLMKLFNDVEKRYVNKLGQNYSLFLTVHGVFTAQGGETIEGSSIANRQATVGVSAAKG